MTSSIRRLESEVHYGQKRIDGTEDGPAPDKADRCLPAEDGD